MLRGLLEGVGSSPLLAPQASGRQETSSNSRVTGDACTNPVKKDAILMDRAWELRESIVDGAIRLEIERGGYCWK